MSIIWRIVKWECQSFDGLSSENVNHLTDCQVRMPIIWRIVKWECQSFDGLSSENVNHLTDCQVRMPIIWRIVKWECQSFDGLRSENVDHLTDLQYWWIGFTRRSVLDCWHLWSWNWPLALTTGTDHWDGIIISFSSPVISCSRWSQPSERSPQFNLLTTSHPIFAAIFFGHVYDIDIKLPAKIAVPFGVAIFNIARLQ